MPRIIGVDIPGNKRIAFSLRYLYGIGPAKALEIIERVQIPEDLKAKDLTPDQIAAITKILQDDIVVEGDLRRMLAADIRRLQQINCYRGVRHRRSLPVRGQRTKTNARILFFIPLTAVIYQLIGQGTDRRLAAKG